VLCLSAKSSQVSIWVVIDTYLNFHHYISFQSVTPKLTPKNTGSVVVDSTLYLDGELRVQQSVIKRAK